MTPESDACSRMIGVCDSVTVFQVVTFPVPVFHDHACGVPEGATQLVRSNENEANTRRERVRIGSKESNFRNFTCKQEKNNTLDIVSIEKVCVIHIFDMR